MQPSQKHAPREERRAVPSLSLPCRSGSGRSLPGAEPSCKAKGRVPRWGSAQGQPWGHRGGKGAENAKCKAIRHEPALLHLKGQA